jgi:hypothetical protein
MHQGVGHLEADVSSADDHDRSGSLESLLQPVHLREQRTAAERIRETFPTADIDAWLERNPYQDDATVQRWKADLATIGLT